MKQTFAASTELSFCCYYDFLIPERAISQWIAIVNYFCKLHWSKLMQQIVDFEQKSVRFNVFWTIKFQYSYLSQG